MKEHSGGAPPTAVISVGHWSEENFEIHPVFLPDPARNDRMSELLAEAEDAGEDPIALCLTMLQPQIYSLLGQAMIRILSLLGTSQKPDLAYDQLRWVYGAALMEGQTLPQLAKKHGISKQAFQQGCKPFRYRFNIRCQSARTPEARERMRLRNSRRAKLAQ